MQGSKKWIYPTKEELSSIMFKDKPAPIYEYTYGGRIFSFTETINQVDEFILPLLTRDPYSRRAVISIYDPQTDSSVLNKNTPGMLFIQLLIRNNKLHLFATIRSNDVFFGFPANSYQLFSLQEHLAKKLNTQLGSLTITSTSAHIFLEDLSLMQEIIQL
jgi:thymidylate synthase